MACLCNHHVGSKTQTNLGSRSTVLPQVFLHSHINFTISSIMANRQALGFQSCIGQNLGISDNYFVQEPLGDVYTLDDLPIQPISRMGNTPSVTACVEVIRGLESIEDAEGACANVNKLTPPWGFAGTILTPHQLQIYTRPGDHGVDIVKLIQFTHR